MAPGHQEEWRICIWGPDILNLTRHYIEYIPVMIDYRDTLKRMADPLCDMLHGGNGETREVMRRGVRRAFNADKPERIIRALQGIGYMLGRSLPEQDSQRYLQTIRERLLSEDPGMESFRGEGFGQAILYEAMRLFPFYWHGITEAVELPSNLYPVNPPTELTQSALMQGQEYKQLQALRQHVRDTAGEDVKVCCQRLGIHLRILATHTAYHEPPSTVLEERLLRCPLEAFLFYAPSILLAENISATNDDSKDDSKFFANADFKETFRTCFVKKLGQGLLSIVHQQSPNAGSFHDELKLITTAAHPTINSVINDLYLQIFFRHAFQDEVVGAVEWLEGVGRVIADDPLLLQIKRMAGLLEEEDELENDDNRLALFTRNSTRSLIRNVIPIRLPPKITPDLNQDLQLERQGSKIFQDEDVEQGGNENVDSNLIISDEDDESEREKPKSTPKTSKDDRNSYLKLFIIIFLVMLILVSICYLFFKFKKGQMMTMKDQTQPENPARVN